MNEVYRIRAVALKPTRDYDEFDPPLLHDYPAFELPEGSHILSAEYVGTRLLVKYAERISAVAGVSPEAT